MTAKHIQCKCKSKNLHTFTPIHMKQMPSFKQTHSCSRMSNVCKYVNVYFVSVSVVYYDTWCLCVYIGILAEYGILCSFSNAPCNQSLTLLITECPKITTRWRTFSLQCFSPIKPVLWQKILLDMLKKKVKFNCKRDRVHTWSSYYVKIVDIAIPYRSVHISLSKQKPDTKRKKSATNRHYEGG